MLCLLSCVERFEAIMCSTAHNTSPRFTGTTLVYHCYVDLWKGTSERFAMAYQGIGKDNMLTHRIGAADAATNEKDQAI